MHVMTKPFTMEALTSRVKTILSDDQMPVESVLD